MTSSPRRKAGSGTRSRPGAVLSWWGNVLAWLLLLVVLAVATATIAVPRFAGATPYTVLSNSMEPHYPPGTLLIVRPTPVSALAVGDVITYQLRSGDPTVVSHRITAITYVADGNVAFRTRGDHNPSADPDPVRPVQIRGELWYAVPWVGRLTTWLGGSTRLAVVAVVAAGLVLYAVGLLVSAARDHRRRDRPDAPAAVPR